MADNYVIRIATARRIGGAHRKVRDVTARLSDLKEREGVLRCIANTCLGKHTRKHAQTHMQTRAHARTGKGKEKGRKEKERKGYPTPPPTPYPPPRRM